MTFMNHSRYGFWSEVGGSNPGVWMIDLGYFANRRPIFNMSSVNGLSYDGETQRLYVLNGDTGEIYNCDMEYVQGMLLCFLVCRHIVSLVDD